MSELQGQADRLVRERRSAEARVTQLQQVVEEEKVADRIDTVEEVSIEMKEVVTVEGEEWQEAISPTFFPQCV